MKLLDWAATAGRVLLETTADRAALELVANAPLALAVFRTEKFARISASSSWLTLFGPQEPAPASICEALERSLRSRSTLEIPELTFRRDGKPHELERACRIVILPVLSGAVPRVVASACDATDEVVARRLEVPPTVAIWSGIDRGIDYSNAAWRAYSTNEPEGPDLDWRRFVFADDLVRCEETFADAVRNRGTAESEARLRRADGTFRWHQLRFRVEPDGRWYATALDIEDTHHAQKQRIALLDRLLVALSEAESANRAKDNFLATVSHELRAPVTTIMLWEKVLRDHIDDVKLRARALDAIRESASAQSRLVGDLLDISRAISGKLRLERRRIVVENVLAAAVEAALPAANAKQIEITTQYRRVGRVIADAARLRQVFDNLLSNAVKFTPPGGHIYVTVDRDRGNVVIAIRDTGRGIEESFLRRLFTPFVQDEEVLTRSEGGLGLGLAIANQLVALHDGTLSAASPGSGQGSTFTITLPIANRRTATPSPAPPPPPKARRLDGVRVLLIDDEPRVREALKVLLARVGAEVLTAGSAAEAREVLERASADVLICDISMPGEDGYAFIRSLRATKGNAQNVPAIALTAYASDRDRERAAAAGFDAHLAKPIQLTGLAAAIDHLLAARRP